MRFPCADTGAATDASTSTGISIADYVDDVAAVIDWLGEKPVLIGHSMGGFIIQKYLERHTVPAACCSARCRRKG